MNKTAQKTAELVLSNWKRVSIRNERIVGCTVECAKMFVPRAGQLEL
jgi:hypothetical protein